MFINAHQIRAARGYLNWTLAYLAREVGVGTTTISAIETGRSAGSLDLLSRIVYRFQAAGLEFTDEGGVRPRRGSTVTTYEGHEGLITFYEDVFAVAGSMENPDICVASTDEKLYRYWPGERVYSHIDRMGRPDLKMRVLIGEGDSNPPAAGHVDYRRIPRDQFGHVPVYLYGHKAAFAGFLDDDVIVTVVDNKAVTDSLRRMFELLWANSIEAAPALEARKSA